MRFAQIARRSLTEGFPKSGHKYQYEIDHTHIWMGKGRRRQVEFACTWSHELIKLSTNGDQKDELLLGTDRLPRWLVHLFPSGNTRKKVCAYF